MGSEEKPRFRTSWLTWKVKREGRSFRIYVVEPRTYDPGTHAEIFEAALRKFIAPDQTFEGAMVSRDAHERARSRKRLRPFDLLTFPEAFLAADTLVQFLRAVAAGRISFRCIHVGLRPNDNGGTHLFKVEDIKLLIHNLKDIRELQATDLAQCVCCCNRKMKSTLRK